MPIDKVAGLAATITPSLPTARFRPVDRSPLEQRLTVAAPPRAPAPAPTPTLRARQALEEVSAAQNRLDRVLALAQSGKSFSPAELLALQANVYRASQQLDLAGKVVEKATSGIKQVLQTQV